MRWTLFASFLLMAAPAVRGAERVDFGYAFAPPHRITVGRPGASEKTLLDVTPGALTASWSYDDLRSTPLAILKLPHTDWHVKIEPLVDGKPIESSTWTRTEGYLPVLENSYQSAAGTVLIEASGAEAAALFRVTVKNADSREHVFSARATVQSGWVAHNPAWMQAWRNPAALLACQWDRPDRVLMFATGGTDYPTERMSMTLRWKLAPGETKTGWIVRPHRAFEADLPALQKKDWTAELEAAKREWRGLIARASQFDIPDAGVRNALYASLADLFIMREPLLNGYVGTLCGTEGYRSTNPFEPSLAAVALDQLRLHSEAADGLRVHLDMQEPSGEWADPKGWAHDMWGAAGMKAWAAMEHYRLTGDRAYLEALYPRLVANSRWQEQQRARSRILENGRKTATYGLMPRGMGDGGLMAADDYYGVFHPHNILAVFADKLAVEAAETLGRKADLPELRRIYATGFKDLRASFELGAIDENGYRWLPGSPRNPSGSRWGVLYALVPAGLLEPGDPLVTGTLRRIEAVVSPGGQPLHTGWMPDGAWVAITLDNVAESYLVRGDGDTAIRYLYSTLNHGTPLYTWCEERGAEPGTKKTSGDRQHLWTPVAVVRFLRDAMVMEQGDRLHLGLATARSWLEQGKQVGVRAAPSSFGDVSYRLESDVEHGVIRAEVDPPTREAPAEIVLHVRHPRGEKIRQVSVNGHAWTRFDVDAIRLQPGQGKLRVEARF